jgi:DNA-binding GntR family transcriptional regulator
MLSCMSAVETIPPAPLVRSAGDLAAEQIRLAILDGRLAPGRRLKESDVAQAFRMSRTPVRDALRRLERDGLVVQAPNRGATVRRLTADELRDTYEVRALLEGHAARRAAEAITEAQLDALRESCTQFRAIREADAPTIDHVRENARFHGLVLEASGRPKLCGVARDLTNLPLIYRTYAWYSPAQRVRAERDHEHLVDALADGDADRAERLTREHLLEGLAVLLDHVDDAGNLA